MIEAVNCFSLLFHLQSFQHGQDAIPLKKVKTSNQQINALGLVLQQGKDTSGPCIYISIVSISIAIHILACVILNFAKI